MRYIPYGHHWINKDDIKEVVKVLESDWITQGQKIEEFEDALCKYTGAKYAVAVSSGTAALHIACLAAGIEEGDEVITSPITFVASANCVLYCGGKPVFADIQEDTINIDPEEIKKRITKRTKAVIPVHFAGHPCDLEEIRDIAKKNNLLVIEDACHALGAEYKGSRIGSCKYSDMAIFSFHPVKSITTGEGGAVLTNNREFYEKLLMLRNHGITKDVRFIKKKLVPWYYEMLYLGFNYRITDIQAALGVSQLKKLDSFIIKRQQLVNCYNKIFKDTHWIRMLSIKEDNKSAFHLYIIVIDFKKMKDTKKNAVEYLKKFGVGTQVHYIPIHLQRFYRKNLGFKYGDYPKAEKYYEKSLTLPLYPRLRKSQINYIANKVLDLY